jgi:hypothetical protein
MTQERIQQLRDELRLSIARLFNGSVGGSRSVPYWVDIADELTTLGVDRPELIRLVVERGCGRQPPEVVAERLAKELDLQFSAPLDAKVAFHVIGAARAGRIIATNSLQEIDGFIGEWLYEDQADSELLAQFRNASDPDWYLRFMEHVGLPWLHTAEHDIENCLYAQRTACPTVFLEWTKETLRSDGAAVDRLVSLVHEGCRDYLSGLPHEITQPA